ncbi:hypothetical protein ACFLRT_03875, partial [Acidobacteriota bacterium]
MYNSQETKPREVGRNLIIVFSLVFSILCFWAFSSLSTTGNNGVVTTSIISVRIGGLGIDTPGIGSILAKNPDSKSNKKI